MQSHLLILTQASTHFVTLIFVRPEVRKLANLPYPKQVQSSPHFLALIFPSSKVILVTASCSNPVESSQHSPTLIFQVLNRRIATESCLKSVETSHHFPLYCSQLFTTASLAVLSFECFWAQFLYHFSFHANAAIVTPTTCSQRQVNLENTIKRQEKIM